MFKRYQEGFMKKKTAGATGVEPVTSCFGDKCCYQLSYAPRYLTKLLYSAANSFAIL